MTRATGLCILVTLSLVAGCVEERRVLPNNESPGKGISIASSPSDEGARGPEQAFIKATEEHPDSPQVWWALGDYYETHNRFAEAIEAYIKLDETTAEVSRANPLPNGMPQPFTCGDYHLGRAYAKARMYPEAVIHLQKVLELQPVDPKDGSTNAHFRESHFILGAIYYDNRQWTPAREQFETFKLLGGEPERADPWLMRMDEQEYLVHNPPSNAVRQTGSSAPRTPAQGGPRRVPSPGTDPAPAPGSTPPPAPAPRPAPPRSVPQAAPPAAAPQQQPPARPAPQEAPPPAPAPR